VNYFSKVIATASEKESKKQKKKSQNHNKGKLWKSTTTPYKNPDNVNYFVYEYLIQILSQHMAMNMR
jgi:hypothetical protein